MGITMSLFNNDEEYDKQLVVEEPLVEEHQKKKRKSKNKTLKRKRKAVTWDNI